MSPLKICAGFAAIGIVLGSMAGLSVSAEEEKTFTDEMLTYTKISDGVSITACKVSTTSLSLPDNIDGYPILEVGEGAFAECAGLTTVDFSKTKIRSIGNNAFTGCEKLQTLKLPDTLQTIGSGAFYNCASLTELSIPDSVSEIGSYAFAYCFALDKVKLPTKLTTLLGATFYYDYELSEVTLPKSLETLSALTFVGCYDLQSVTLPASLKTIEPLAFLGCIGMKEFTVDANNTAFSVGEDGALYNKDGSNLLIYPSGNGVKECTIADTVTEIAPYAFAGSLSLETVTMPQTLQGVLPEGCFSDCYSLHKVNCLPENLSEISGSLFAGCNALENLTLPENCTSIGNYGFYECAALTEFTIPESVKSIGDCAFCGCENLTTMTIPVGTTLGSYAVGFSTPAEDAEDSTPVLRKDFVLHGNSKSDAKRFAKANGVSFKQDDFNFRLLFLIIGITAAVLFVILTIVDIVRKKKSAPEQPAESQSDESFVDPSYQSILAEDDEDMTDVEENSTESENSEESES